jgi:dTDP-4-dehydrorhamnose reductase
VRIALVGAEGQLGAAVARECESAHDVVEIRHAMLDVTNDAAVYEMMRNARPDAIVNCAAYNDVDGAEDHAVDALNLNAFAVRALARAAAECKAVLVHYSTDFVFDGKANQPYTETDPPNPRGAYAASKLMGEWFAGDAPRAYVLRVESLFGSVKGARPAKGSVASILKSIQSGAETRVFEDRTISPTYVFDAAVATRKLLEQSAPAGLYHCVNSGSCTWVGLAREIARQVGVEPELVPVRMADATLRAERPMYCVLSNAKLASLGIIMPDWQEAIARYVTQTTAERVR